MAMVNQMTNPTMGVPYNLANMKDSRWLTLEVCREFQRSKCSRTEQECKFAHPPPNVEVQNGRVTCCFDSIKGKCQRKDPPCKYLHPPQHLREQLLQNGKNNLILRNLQMQVAQFGQFPPMVPNVIPFAHHYPSPVQTAAYNPYSLSAGAPGLSASMHGGVTVSTSDALHNTSHIPTIMSAPQQQVMAVSTGATKVARPDRLEVCREWQRATCTRTAAECRFAHPPDHVIVDSCDNQVTVCMDFIKGKCLRDTCRYFHPPQHLAIQIKAAQQRLSYPQSMAPADHVIHEVCSQCPSSFNAAAAAASQAVAAAQNQVAEAVMKGKKRTLEEELILGTVQAGLPAGLVPCMKRPALADKCTGLPTMYHQQSHAAAAAANNHVANYHQAALAAMQFQGQTFVPVSSHHQPDDAVYWKNGITMAAFPGQFAGHAPSLQRF